MLPVVGRSDLPMVTSSRPIPWGARGVAAVSVLAVLAACSNQRSDDGAAMREKDASTAQVVDASVMEMDASAPITIEGDFTCQDAPRQLLDLNAWIPSDAAAVQVPTVAANASHVYALVNWRPGGPNSGMLWNQVLISMPKGMGAAVQLARTEGLVGNASGLSATGDGVVFSRASSETDGRGSIIYLHDNGPKQVVLAKTNGAVNAVAADEMYAYFVDRDGTKSVPLAGGDVQLLASVVSISVTIIYGELYLPTRMGMFAVNLTNRTTRDLHIVGSLPVACGNGAVCMMTDPIVPASTLVRLTEGGGMVTLADNIQQPQAIVYDDRNFFIGAGHGLDLIRVPDQGGGTLELSQAASAVAQTEDCLYWTNDNGVSAWSKHIADNAGM